jgi:hypothetical protein
MALGVSDRETVLELFTGVGFVGMKQESGQGMCEKTSNYSKGESSEKKFEC